MAPNYTVRKIIAITVFFSFFLFLPFIARGATLSFSPPSGTFEVGERVPIKVMVNTSGGIQFNAVSAVVSFPNSIFSIESTSKSSSVLSFWVTEPTISKSAGTVKFEGVVLGGFTGSTGSAVTVNLLATKVGTGTASFKSGQILANDGQGTDITGNLLASTFSVKQATPKPIPPPIVPAPAPEIPQPAPTLKAPEIMLGTKYGAQAIFGTSDYPKTQALITFMAQDGVKVFILGVSDAQGEFNVVVPSSLKRGTYTVNAVMIKEDKTNSQSSNTIIIKIGSIISDVGWEIKLLIILLILAIIYLILRIYIHFGDKDKKRNAIIGELREAENVIHKSFDALRDDVADRARGIVSSVERTNIEELKKDLDSTEKVITKEVKDIEG